MGEAYLLLYFVPRVEWFSCLSDWSGGVPTQQLLYRILVFPWGVLRASSILSVPMFHDIFTLWWSVPGARDLIILIMRKSWSSALPDCWYLWVAVCFPDRLSPSGQLMHRFMILSILTVLWVCQNWIWWWAAPSKLNRRHLSLEMHLQPWQSHISISGISRKKVE